MNLDMESGAEAPQSKRSRGVVCSLEPREASGVRRFTAALGSCSLSSSKRNRSLPMNLKMASLTILRHGLGGGQGPDRPTLPKNSRCNRSRSGMEASRQTKLGIAISPLRVSATSQTTCSEPVAPKYTNTSHASR